MVTHKNDARRPMNIRYALRTRSSPTSTTATTSRSTQVTPPSTIATTTSTRSTQVPTTSSRTTATATASSQFPPTPTSTTLITRPNQASPTSSTRLPVGLSSSSTPSTNTNNSVNANSSTEYQIRTRSSIRSKRAASGHSPSSVITPNIASLVGSTGSNGAVPSTPLPQGPRGTKRSRSDRESSASKRSKRDVPESNPDAAMDDAASDAEASSHDIPATITQESSSTRTGTRGTKCASSEPTSSSKRRKTGDANATRKPKKKTKRWTSKKKSVRKTTPKRETYAIKGNLVRNVDLPADAGLIGKYILLEWPIRRKVEWYTCRVVAYDSITRLHKVLYEDDDFSFERTADLHERRWKLIAVDPFAKNRQLPIDRAERWLGSIVHVNPNPNSDSPQDLLAKLAYVYEVKNNGRGEPRRGVRFSVREKVVPILKFCWIHGGGTDSNGTKLEEGDTQEFAAGTVVLQFAAPTQ